MPQEGTYDAVVVAEEGPAVAASNPAAAVAADEELAVASEQAACAASDAAAAAAATEEHKAQEHLAVAASNAAQACTPEKQNEIAAPQEEPTKMTECAAADAAAAVAEAMIASRATSAQAEAAAAALRHPSPAPLRLREIAAPLCVQTTVAGDSAKVPVMAAVEGPAQSRRPKSVEAWYQKEGGCLEKLLDLARAVRQPRQSVGYSAFLVFAMLRKLRIWVWEGNNRVDIASVFLPSWARENMSASVEADAVCCTAVPCNNGPPTFAPVSAQHPLRTATHYVAVVHTGVIDDSDTTSLDGYYASLGQQVISTVADGDCGIDAMLKIVGERSTPLARKQLREELADFMVGRIQQRWFQEVMAACQEVTWEAVKQFRELEQCVSEGHLVAPSVVAPAVAEAAEDVSSRAASCVRRVAESGCVAHRLEG